MKHLYLGSHDDPVVNAVIFAVMELVEQLGLSTEQVEAVAQAARTGYRVAGNDS